MTSKKIMEDQPKNFTRLLEIFQEYLYMHIQPYQCDFIAMQCKVDSFLTEVEHAQILHTENSNKTLKLIQVLCQKQQQGVFQSFLSALNERGLDYVAQQLRGDPVSTSFFEDYYKHVVEVFYGQVSQELELTTILSDYGPELLDDHSRQVVEAQLTNIDKTAKFLYLIAKRPGMMEKFIDRLRSTEVYGRLLADLEGDTEEKRCFLDVFLSNASLIEEQLEPRDILDFMDLPDAKRDHIHCLEPREQRVKTFLNILVNRPFGWFKNLVAALRRPEVTTDYSDLIEALDTESSTEDQPSTSTPSPTSTIEKLQLLDINEKTQEFSCKEPPSESDDTEAPPNPSSDEIAGQVKDIAPRISAPDEAAEGPSIASDKPAPDDTSPKRLDEACEPQFRKYQLELAESATQGNNCVIVAPTNSGKTFVALRICLEHLKNGGKKVIFLAPTRILVEQHYDLFTKYVDGRFRLDQLTGDTDFTTPVVEVLRQCQALVMTHQVLLNVIKNEKFNICDISLLLFDECHNAMNDHPYKQLMDFYMDKKFAPAPARDDLPQIVGLTAWTGSGKASTIDSALYHIKTLLAVLDVITAPIQVVKHKEELARYLKDAEAGGSVIVPVDKLRNDPFRATVEKVMDEIEGSVRRILLENENVIGEDFKFINVNKRGDQQYEQEILDFHSRSVTLEDKSLSQKLQLCSQYLTEYNNALMVNDHVRPSDAKDYIDKTLFSGPPLNPTEHDLKELHDDSGLDKLAIDRPNALLQKLTAILREHFSKKEDSRCLIFARTREIARCLAVCLEENPSMRDLHLAPEYLIGAKGLTMADQENRLQNFREGISKVMIATTVAEEGIDIQACNLVITYNHVTSEVAHVQRKGRGRAEGSLMYILAYSDSKYIEKTTVVAARTKLTKKGLQLISEMDAEDLALQIRGIQRRLRAAASLSKVAPHKTSGQLWKLLCRKCHRLVTTSENFRRIKGMHHAVIDTDFQAKRTVIPWNPAQQLSIDEFVIGRVHCGQQTCQLAWGSQMLYKVVPVSVLKISNFVLVSDQNQRRLVKRWKDAPFRVQELQDEDLISLNDMLYFQDDSDTTNLLSVD